MEAPLTVVLCAGQSRRFGASKLDMRCAGQPVGSWVLQAASNAGLPPGAVVIGPEPPEFLSTWPAWIRLVNHSPGAGLSSSLAIAARAAMTRESSAMLVLLADMPLVEPEFLRLLLADAAPAATLQDDGRPGVPALLSRQMYPALCDLDGDRGAGSLLAQQTELRILAAPAGMLTDIDRPEDLVRAEELLSVRGAGTVLH